MAHLGGVGWWEIYLKCGNDQCILSHWQLFWHLGIYLLWQIFMGFKLRSVVASWVYLTHCRDRNSCKAVLACEREQDICLLWHITVTWKCIIFFVWVPLYFSLWVNWFVCIVQLQHPPVACWASQWQLDTYMAKVNVQQPWLISLLIPADP